MKPPEGPPSVTVPKVKGSSRKSVLSMIRNTVESRMQEKQEKEKFQFNHQTWNFHGRKYNTTLPQFNSNSSNGGPSASNVPPPNSHPGNAQALSLGSAGTGSNGNSSSSSSNTTTGSMYGFSKYESSSLGGGSDMNNTTNGNAQYNPVGSNVPGNNTSGGSGGSGGSNDNISPLHRIRTKAEKKQLFPNLLSQIEQENSNKEAERIQQNSHILSHRQGPHPMNSTSVFDFKEEEDEYKPKITIPQPPPPSASLNNNTSSSLMNAPAKKPRSPKKTDGTRRNSLPKKGAKSSPASAALLLPQTPSLSSVDPSRPEKNEDKSMSVGGGGGETDPTTALGQGTIQATKAVTKLAAVDSIDAFWAACDSFLDDLQSNPNSIKSRRGGLWQKLKSKSKVKLDPANASGGVIGGGTTGAAVPSTPSSNKGGRGVRIRKNSSEEDSDFEINEEKSDEEDEEEDSESNDNSDDSDEEDDEDGARSRSAGSSEIRRRRTVKKRRSCVINSDDDNSGEGEDKSEVEEDVSSERKAIGKSIGGSSKKNNKGDSKGKPKDESEDNTVESVGKKGAKGNKSNSGNGGGGGRRDGSKSGSESRAASKVRRKGKSSSRRRRSTRKRKTVIGSRSETGGVGGAAATGISDLDDDEDATSRSSIGSEASESDNSDSESYLHSLDSDDSDRSDDSDETEDSDEDSDQSGSSSGLRKRKKGSVAGGSCGPANKKSKKGRSAGKKKNRRKNDASGWKKKGRSTRSKSSDVKKGISSKRTRSGSKNDEEDEDDESFEPKGVFKSRSGKGGRKRKLPKRNCAPVPGNGKLKDISGESKSNFPMISSYIPWGIMCTTFVFGDWSIQHS
jgi:hypothetical protein